jgi:hypothetical protein
MDRGLIEFLGPQGIATQIYLYVNKLTQLSLGFTFHFLFLIIASLMIFVLFFGG